MAPRAACAALSPDSPLGAPAAPELDLRGQASAWLSANDAAAGLGFGLRYIPALSLSLGLSPALTLDAEASVNGSFSGFALRGAQTTTDSRLKLYRAWVRLSSARFEARLGLQKINFGSAVLLRPLMWFDRLDPRDPLQLTDGVTGLLVRYYFPGNANAWGWALAGDDEPKGWEMSPTARRSMEFGGRFQAPLLKGELGFSYHRRRADLSRGLVTEIALRDSVAPEDRWALDGKWDLAAGMSAWAEGALVHQHYSGLAHPCRRFLTVGADTTLALGAGLHLLAEHLTLATAPGALAKGETVDFTAATASLPLGLLDRLSAIIFYDWRGRNVFSFLSWQRTYDNWQIHLIGFWNPETGGIMPAAAGYNSFQGKGLMLMAVFNH
ncbi:MAG: hypothetical protein JW747_00045 [Candidatus Aminicenantes bacterium]|nr:hypothetical protein [Candidatus Aminicenantes bacterium]